jgi:hypothetical protein
MPSQTYHEKSWTSIFVLTMITILVIPIAFQITLAVTFNNIEPKKLSLSDTQESRAQYNDIGRTVLYSIVIVFVIITRLRWTRYGRRVTKPKIIVESIFFLIIGSIVIFDSFNYIGVSIIYLIPYLILFLGVQHYSYSHSNRLISFWRESESGSIYVKGGTHIHLAYMIGTTSRVLISILFIGSLFAPSRPGLIYINNSTLVLIVIAIDFLLMISLGLLLGMNRRILTRYKLINAGTGDISEK